MRKVLLASAAATFALMGVANFAHAQVVDNTDGAGPTPGSVSVRLNGRFRFYAGVSSGSINSDSLPTATATAGTATSPDSGTNKTSNYGILDYARLYPGFDGVAANGLKYGASLEVREDNAYGAGGANYGSISASDRSRNALYLRRQWGYLGSDKLGTLRMGSADGALSLDLVGTFENFNDGGWNGDVMGLMPGAEVLTWPFADSSNEYATTKIVYLSPQFYGVDFGLSYEPSTAAGGDSGGCSAASLAENTSTQIGTGQGVPSQGCDALSSTSTGDYARRKNTYEGVLRYRGTIGPVGIAAMGGYTGSSRVLDSSTPQRAQQYNDLSIAVAGLSLTYGGFTVGGNYQRGQYNAGWALSPKNTNGTPTEDASAWIVGATYTFGPLIVGASYLDSGSPGSQGANNLAAGGHQRREQGIAAGGTYTLAPGVSLFLSYLWSQRKQNGYNFETGATTGAAASQFNKVDGQILSVGTSFAW
jgi:predicted porin